MKLISIQPLNIPDIKVIRFARFLDHRGYFTEIYRQDDFLHKPELTFMNTSSFLQANESHSRQGAIRGLHFQWKPYMGKLIRTIQGHMIDLVCDIRKDSPTFGKILAYDMPSSPEKEYAEWIWVPPGFAHGNFFLADTTIEYFCSGAYNPECEGCISPFAKDINWSEANPKLKTSFDHMANNNPLISKKDGLGLSLAQWISHPASKHFPYPMPKP